MTSVFYGHSHTCVTWHASSYSQGDSSTWGTAAPLTCVTWLQAPIGKRMPPYTAVTSAPPGARNSCPAQYVPDMSLLPRLPSRRSMPLGDLDQGQEAFADLKPSRSVPQRFKANTEPEEGLQTQLSRRSSTSKRQTGR